jgi:hypothetical protein
MGRTVRPMHPYRCGNPSKSGNHCRSHELGRPIQAFETAAVGRLSFVRPSIFASICGREYGPICATVMA